MLPRRSGLRPREALQCHPRRPAPQLRRAQRPLDDGHPDRRAGDEPPPGPAGPARRPATHDLAGGPGPDQAADLGDQPQGPGRRALPAGRPPARPGRRRGDRARQNRSGARLGLGLLPHGRAEPGQGGRAVGRRARGRRSFRRRAPGRGDRRRHRRRAQVARRGRLAPGSGSGFAGTRRPKRSSTRRGPAPAGARASGSPARVARARFVYRNAASTSRPRTSMERGETGPGQASRTIRSTPARA